MFTARRSPNEKLSAIIHRKYCERRGKKCNDRFVDCFDKSSIIEVATLSPLLAYFWSTKHQRVETIYRDYKSTMEQAFGVIRAVLQMPYERVLRRSPAISLWSSKVIIVLNRRVTQCKRQKRSTRLSFLF